MTAPAASTAPAAGPIGVFDSGYGGLTILRQIRQYLPRYDYLYLGDNARAPYGPRSFEVVYEYTLQAVEALFARGCRLVILACNTASAKALRTIQQNDLARIDPRAAYWASYAPRSRPSAPSPAHATSACWPPPGRSTRDPTRSKFTSSSPTSP